MYCRRSEHYGDLSEVSDIVAIVCVVREAAGITGTSRRLPLEPDRAGGTQH